MSKEIESFLELDNEEVLAQNIGRMQFLTELQRLKILSRADNELPREVYLKAKKLILDLACDKKVYEIAGLPYHEGPPEGEKLFKTAIADFLLRNN